MVKELKNTTKSKLAVRAGVSKLAKVVKVTLGPKGLNVMLPNGVSTKDGVSVANEVSVSEPFENVAIQLVESKHHQKQTMLLVTEPQRR